jgi:hypothetical protein
MDEDHEEYQEPSEEQIMDDELTEDNEEMLPDQEMLKKEDMNIDIDNELHEPEVEEIEERSSDWVEKEKEDHQELEVKLTKFSEKDNKNLIFKNEYESVESQEDQYEESDDGRTMGTENEEEFNPFQGKGKAYVYNY